MPPCGHTAGCVEAAACGVGGGEGQAGWQKDDSRDLVAQLPKLRAQRSKAQCVRSIGGRWQRGSCRAAPLWLPRLTLGGRATPPTPASPAAAGAASRRRPPEAPP